jgi:hypothetical protein
VAYNTGTDPTLTELINRYWVPKVFSKQLIEHTKSKLVIAESVNHDYERELRIGDQVYIPCTTEPSTSDVTPGTEITSSDVTTAGKSITVNTWKGVRSEISEMAKIEDAVGYLAKTANSLSYAVLKAIDSSLGALFSGLAGDSVYGADGQEFTDDIVLALMEYLDEGDVPEDDRCIISDPSSKVDLLRIDKFVRNDYVRNPVVPTGQFGMIYNMQVKITNNLTAVSSGTGNYGVMMHRDALACVVQKTPYSQKIDDPKFHRTLLQVKVIYGVSELRDTFGRSFYTRKS